MDIKKLNFNHGHTIAPMMKRMRDATLTMPIIHEHTDRCARSKRWLQTKPGRVFVTTALSVLGGSIIAPIDHATTGTPIGNAFILWLSITTLLGIGAGVIWIIWR